MDNYFHIGKNGPCPCEAKFYRCPLGTHYKNMQYAQEEYERRERMYGCLLREQTECGDVLEEFLYKIQSGDATKRDIKKVEEAVKGFSMLTYKASIVQTLEKAVDKYRNGLKEEAVGDVMEAMDISDGEYTALVLSSSFDSPGSNGGLATAVQWARRYISENYQNYKSGNDVVNDFVRKGFMTQSCADSIKNTEAFATLHSLVRAWKKDKKRIVSYAEFLVYAGYCDHSGMTKAVDEAYRVIDKIDGDIPIHVSHAYANMQNIKTAKELAKAVVDGSISHCVDDAMGLTRQFLEVKTKEELYDLLTEQITQMKIRTDFPDDIVVNPAKIHFAEEAKKYENDWM